MPTRTRKPEKSPAFQWYPREYMASTFVMGLSHEEAGLYRHLLDVSWLDNGMPADPAAIFAFAKCATRERFDQLWMKLEPKFPVFPDGFRRNHRQEQERKKQRKNRRQKQLAADARWHKKGQSRHADAHAAASAAALHPVCLPDSGLQFALPGSHSSQDQVHRRAARAGLSKDEQRLCALLDAQLIQPLIAKHGRIPGTPEALVEALRAEAEACDLPGATDAALVRVVRHALKRWRRSA